MLAHGLDGPTLDALAVLERRTVAADGGRLKLEWGVLRRDRDLEAALWWEGDRLLGYAGLYAFGPPDVEVAGAVDPAARRRGIATALLDAALARAREREYARALLVTPRESVGGRGLARAREATFDHAEHALELLGEPADGPTDPRLTLRRAGAADAPAVARLLAEGFGWAAPAGDRQEATEHTLLAERDGAPVATLRVDDGGDSVGVYGFVVEASLRGQGIGRDLLRRVCRQARDRGARRVTLEVAVENDRALGLYLSLGFERRTTEDYWALSLR